MPVGTTCSDRRRLGRACAPRGSIGLRLRRASPGQPGRAAPYPPPRRPDEKRIEAPGDPRPLAGLDVENLDARRRVPEDRAARALVQFQMKRPISSGPSRYQQRSARPMDLRPSVGSSTTSSAGPPLFTSTQPSTDERTVELSGPSMVGSGGGAGAIAQDATATTAQPMGSSGRSTAAATAHNRRISNRLRQGLAGTRAEALLDMTSAGGSCGPPGPPGADPQCR